MISKTRLLENPALSKAASKLYLNTLAKTFNYTEYYNAFNPEQYYKFVGSPTWENFVEVGNKIVEALKSNRLSPDAKVLDGGCGTGRVTEPLTKYLSDKAIYVGFDIGKEAIEYCQAKYKQRNYHFIVTDGTTLPTLGYKFGAILFMSVFTHLYQTETLQLLELCKPALADGGKVYASFWFSGDKDSLVHTDTVNGTRERMEYSRKYLYRLLRAEGWNITEQHWGLRQKILVLSKAASLA